MSSLEATDDERIDVRKRSGSVFINSNETEVEESVPVSLLSFGQSKSKEIINGVAPISLKEVESYCKDLKNIYSYALESMKHFLGSPAYPYITQPKQLYPYILFLCEGLSDHEYVAIDHIISDKQLINVQLTVLVKEAKIIHPKVTEFSHIFCKLWITSGQEQLTTVKDSSSFLLWDETFILDVTNYECDVFHIEVWSSRSKLFEQLSNVSFESFKTDDPLAEEKGMHFLGDAAEYVKCLPCVGENVLWTLKKGPRKIYTKGQIKIYLQLGTKRGQDFILHIHCHMTLIRLCYEKQVMSSEDTSVLWKNWLEILPNTALTLIQQHALQNGLLPLEQCLCSWLVTSSLKMRREDRISFYLLNDLLEYLFANITEDSIGQMQDVLFKSITDFSGFALDMLGELHQHFNLENIEMADELYYLLRCYSCIDLKVNSNYMESYKAIEEEASFFYLKIISELKKDLQIDDSVEKMSDGLKDIMKIYLKNQIVLDDILSRAWNVTYSSITYKKLDDVVCSTVQPMIKHLMVMVEDPARKRKTSESIKMLQLYHNVRNLVNYVVNCIPAEKCLLRMVGYSEWFGEEMALEWFLLCDLYTRPFIQRAVLADAMERLNRNIVHSTSVPDVAAIIDEMVIEVWMKLKWKDQFYTHGALIEAIKSCVLDYSRSIMDRIELEGYYCHMDNFEVAPKLCVALSNICAMSEHLNKTKKKVQRELIAAETAMHFVITDPLISVQSEMINLLTKIFLMMFIKINRRIKQLIKATVKSKVELFNSLCGDLCSYVDNSLEVLYCNLKSEAFYVILRHMWIILLKGLKNGLKYSKGCFVTRKRRLNIYMITLQSLNQMENIFFCDGHGLTPYEMANKLCEELKHGLEAKLQVK